MGRGLAREVIEVELINWKTTAVGATALLVWIVNAIFKVNIPDSAIQGITLVLIALGFYFAKDHDVTGTPK